MELGQKAVAIGCGEQFTVVVGAADTFSFGANDNGQLGRGGEPFELSPLALPRAQSVCCGLSHTVVQTERGVYGFGSNKQLQLGQPDDVSAVKDPQVLYEHCEVGNLGACCNLSWAALTEGMPDFAQGVLVMPRRADALAIRAPHRLLTIDSDLEPAWNGPVWLTLQGDRPLSQTACMENIAWCATESKRDVTWLLSGQQVSCIHPLTLHGREDTDAGVHALQLKAQPGVDISTSSAGQKLDLRNVPVWLWSQVDALTNAAHTDESAVTYRNLPSTMTTDVFSMPWPRRSQ